MPGLRPFSCDESFHHGDRWLRPAETNRRVVFASHNASRGHRTPADACHVSCNEKFNKTGQEGTLSRPDRLKIITGIFLKPTGDQNVALSFEIAKKIAYRNSGGIGIQK